MAIDYAGGRYRPRQELIDAHADVWRRIGEPGTWWNGADRRAMVAEARHAQRCSLCARRREALSPAAIKGHHDSVSDLPAAAVDVIHRVITDPGRLTRTWFDSVILRGLERTRYVELVSVVAASVIVDTLHRALAIELPALPEAVAGEPSRTLVDDLVEDGAWVPIMPQPSRTATETGMPTVPNIRRALSMVAAAPALFFGAFMPHYRLQGLDFAVTQGQAEFVASRVSALNQCFY
jgi:hypothetical protein